MSDEEIDFDDPRFLIEVATPTAELNYAEKRRKTVGRGREKVQTQGRSRKQQEEDAREEGLRTNLIARDTMEGESKALKMMK